MFMTYVQKFGLNAIRVKRTAEKTSCFSKSPGPVPIPAYGSNHALKYPKKISLTGFINQVFSRNSRSFGNIFLRLQNDVYLEIRNFITKRSYFA